MKVSPRIISELTTWIKCHATLFSVDGYNGTQSVAERSYPTCEVRGRSWEDPMSEGWQPRVVTPHPSPGASAESARL